MAEQTIAATSKWAVESGDRTEIRIALVMTGGVSLAVWMGGVAFELHRLTDPATLHNPYERLCDVLGMSATIDVISGSSAGGINGALLALATAHQAPLDFARELWLEDGSVEQLLRAPTEQSPRSLLRGDEHFLPALRRAFLSVPHRSVPATDNLTLLITTTLLQGESRSVTDDFGTVIRDVDHHGTFRFGSDAFKRNDIASLLAKAARCSASFPGAFEASFCRVEFGGTNPSEDNPNMEGIVDTTISRYTVDGGLLKNKPVGPALEAIFEHPPERPVRRVLLYVVPDPGASTYGEPETTDSPPALSRVLLSSLLEIPSAQSIAADLGELRRHNSRVHQQRYLREELLHTGMAAETVDPQQYSRYRELRAQMAADEFLGELTRQLNGMMAAGTLPLAWQAAYEFNSEAYRRRRLTLTEVEHSRLPPTFPERNEHAFARLSELGSEALARCAYVVLDLADRAMAVCHSAELRDQRRQLLATSQALHGILGELRNVRARGASLRETIHRSLRNVDVNSREELTEWACARFAEWDDSSSEVDLSSQLLAICDHLRQVSSAMDGIAAWYQAHPDSGPASSREQVTRVSRVLDKLNPNSMSDDIARRLLVLEVLQIILAVDKMALEQPVELMQVSAESRNGLTYHRQPSDKLTGLQLHHFGAFYKRSWRSNDWLWGRIDAAGWITYLLLQPKRLRQLKDLVADQLGDVPFFDSLIAQLRAIAVGEGALDEHEQDYLGTLWDNDASDIHEELSFLKSPGSSSAKDADPTSLPTTSIAVARGIQYATLLEELPKLNDDMAIDADLGASGRGTLSWRARFRRDWAPNDTDRRPETPVSLFRDSPLPRERLGGEVGSDLFTYTAATAAATALKAGTVAVPKVPAVLAAPLAAARGIGVTLFFMSRWMLQASKTAFAVVTGGVGLGLLLLLVPEHDGANAVGLFLVVAGAIVGLMKAMRVLRVKSSGARRAAAILGATVALLVALFLLLAPWLPDPADQAPARGIRAAGQWLIDHPAAYVAFAALAILAVVGSIPLPRGQERHSAVGPLRMALQDHALKLDLAAFNLSIEPSVTRHLSTQLWSPQRAGEALLAEIKACEGTDVRLRISAVPGVYELEAQHDGHDVGDLTFSSSRIGRKTTHKVTNTPVGPTSRRSWVRVELNGNSNSSKAPASPAPVEATAGS